MRTSVVLLVAAWCASCRSQDPRPPAVETSAAPAFTWGVPEGWRGETIPFPLEFAPDIPHRGVEELRFAPGFFEPAAAGYWTYAFAWVVTDAGALDRPTLEAELTTYFRGLTAAVAKGKTGLPPLDLARIAARIGPQGRGSVLTFDAFGDGREVELDITVDVRPCGAGRAVLFAAAPHGHPLPRDVVASFDCRKRP